jgi:hypothetical protein
MTPIAIWRRIDVVAFGRRIQGEYTIDGNAIRIRTKHGERVVQIGGNVPERIARYALIEMAREDNA